MKQLKPLKPQPPGGIYCRPSDIATRMGKARHGGGFDRSTEDANDRNCGGCCLEIEGEFSGEGNNQIRIASNDVAGQVGILRGPSFAGISLNQEIAFLGISRAMEFVK